MVKEKLQLLGKLIVLTKKITYFVRFLGVGTNLPKMNKLNSMISTVEK